MRSFVTAMGLAFYRGECLFIPKEGTRRLAPFKAATLDPITSLQPKDHLQAFADTMSDEDTGASPSFPGVATISAKHALAEAKVFQDRNARIEHGLRSINTCHNRFGMRFGESATYVTRSAS